MLEKTTFNYQIKILIPLCIRKLRFVEGNTIFVRTTFNYKIESEGLYRILILICFSIFLFSTYIYSTIKLSIYFLYYALKKRTVCFLHAILKNIL